jgi:hypothetical protein
MDFTTLWLTSFSFSSSVTLSERPVPSLRYLTLKSHRRHIGRLRPVTLRLTMCSLVEHTPHWVPCRWLAGDNQVIPIPYFIRSSFLRTYSLLLRLISILCLSLFSDLIVSLNGINVNSLFELIKEKWKAGSQDSRLVPPTTDFDSVLFCSFSV